MRPVCLLAAFLVVLYSTPAVAKVYKCKDGNGNITYSQTPCEAGSSQKTLRSPARVSADADADVCSLVGSVAMQLHTQMQAGSDAQALIRRHGSLSGINPRLLSLINYISSLRHNRDVSSRRVGQLATTKCHNGGFGKVRAADMPLAPEERMRYEALAARKRAAQGPLIQQQKTISVDFDKTPVEQAIREIARKAGVPVKAHGPLGGSVTMKLENVPWQQPLTAIVLQHNLQMGGGVDGVWISPR